MNKVLRFSNNRVIGFLCRILSCLIPDYSRLRKYKNALLSASDLSMQREIAKGLPIQARIAPTTICNFRCLFCEIHKDNILFPNRSKNTVGLDEIKNYEGFLSNIYSLSFYGGSEEPLLAKEFGDVVSYLKKKYGFRMMVNTNASLMTEKLTDILINNGFDYILVSYHAGSRDGYKALMTGSREKVDRRLRYMKERKEELHKNKPVMAFNFALHKANAGEYIDIFNQSKELGIDEVIVNKYYGGRNRLQDKNVSFDHDVDAGNMTLDLIYNKAEELDIALKPNIPDYWSRERKSWKVSSYDKEKYDREKSCSMPWVNIHFNPVLDKENHHYIGVCNRIELMLIDYEIVDLSDNDKALKIWNHPVLQYLRRTVNSKTSINPICKFCKNRDYFVLRNLDERKYAELRDQAVQRFFSEFESRYEYEPIDGIEILCKNPYSDQEYNEKLIEIKEVSSAELGSLKGMEERSNIL